ncbi:Small glutamine-rich tetratricopeptide repeat-containing protein 2 [Malassezia pachydermatis]|uniref:Cytoplasm protein n=1 Tax=Malassezia pachydermatis TaxID=77020 RepID=A0A0M8MJC5_9BASI|nr:cytoplasm protein [Malassezia pachydermatis]KOS13636.1 cytoplasm protein [Malassezia pachydermatis]
MPAPDSSKPLAFAVATWLESQGDATLKDAAASISSVYGFDTSSSSDKETYAKNSPGLQAIFDVFLKTQQRMGSAASASKDEAEDKPKAPSSISDDDAAKAENLKNEGNKFMSSKDYGAALDSYTKAIEINPNSPVFYSNRAAAYSQIGQHDEAIADAKKASEIDPKFGKAYSRLGHALFASGRFAEAAEAYEKGVEVDPSNKLMKSGLEASKAKMKDSGSKDALATQTSPAAAAGTGVGAGAGAGFGAGGMPDLGSLMSNPMVAQMAQQMMQNGGLEQLMNNPMLRQMAENFGSSGQMPDISSLMNNPELRQMAQQFMGGMGGAPRR